MLRFLFTRPQGKMLDTPADAEVFTYHEKSAGRTFLGGFLLATTIEMIVLHIFLAKWNHWVALIVTISSVWVALTVLAQIRAVSFRPIYIHDGRLMLRNGLYDLVEIELADIEEVEKTTRLPEGESALKPLVACFPTSHNVVLNLRKPAVARLLYGQKRDFQIALVFVDDPERFVEALS